MTRKADNQIDVGFFSRGTVPLKNSRGFLDVRPSRAKGSLDTVVYVTEIDKGDSTRVGVDTAGRDKASMTITPENKRKLILALAKGMSEEERTTLAAEIAEIELDEPEGEEE